MEEVGRAVGPQAWTVPPTQIDSSSDEEEALKQSRGNSSKNSQLGSKAISKDDPAVEDASAISLWPSTTSIMVLVAAYIVVTVSFRDLLFLLLGIISTSAIICHLTARKWQKLHTKSRIVVHWEDLKYNFAQTMEKTDLIHSNKGYFINSFSQGLYQHATFDEQIDVLAWVEQTEKRMQKESVAQFDKFVKRYTPELAAEQATPLHSTQDNKASEAKKGKTAQSEKMALQITLRDTSGLFSQLNGLLLKNLEDKGVKDLLSEMKSIMYDLNKSVEEGLTLWSELDNQTLQKLRKIFTQEPTKNPLVLFGWTEESLRQNAPNLIAPGSALRRYLDYLEGLRKVPKTETEVTAATTDALQSNRKSSDPAGTKPAHSNTTVQLLNTDWTEFRKRLDSVGDLQIGMGQGIADTIQRLSKLSDDCQKHIQEGAENIKKLKDYFVETRAKICDLEKEFGSKITVVKSKIKEYREAVEKLSDSEVILRLEYEVRLEIQRLYALKHSHEVEASGLERRLAEIEAFNASTIEIESTLYNQILEFAEASEDGLLPQVNNCLLSRLQSLMGGKEFFPALANPRQGLEIDEPSLTINTGEDSFKRLLQDQLVEETLQPGEGISDWGECRKICEFLHELKRRILKAKEDSKELQLDSANEMEEGIVVNRLSESKMPHISGRDSFVGSTGVGQSTGSFVGSHMESSQLAGSFVLVPELQTATNRNSVQSEPGATAAKSDWTNNRPKLKMLQESIAKDKRVMEQCISIVQEQISSISKIEPRILKLHRSTQVANRQKDSQPVGFKRKVFCRFGWWCLGRRVNLKLQSKSLGLISDAFDFIEKQLESLFERVFKDESVEKMMSTKAKKSIFNMLSTCMWAEVCLRTLCQQTILTSNFREYFITSYLNLMPKKNSQDKQVSKPSLEDAKARQKNIRKGDLFGATEVEAPYISPRVKSSNLLEVPEDSSSPDRRGKMSIDDGHLEGRDMPSNPTTPGIPGKAVCRTPERVQVHEQLSKSQIVSGREENTELLRLDTLNKMFATFFKEWAVNSYFERYVSKKLKKQLNKDRLSCFEEFSITSLKMDSKPLKLNQLQPQQSESFEFLADIDVEYDGLILINIESTLIVNLTVKEYKLKVNIQVKIFQIYGVIRVCLVPLKYGKSW